MSKANKNSKIKEGARRGTKKTLSPAPSPGPVSAPASAVPNQHITDLTEADQKRIQEMLLHAQIEFNKVTSSIVKEKKKEIETLDKQIKEFIGPFMLIGYDLANNPVEMVSASSPAEHDALLERLRRVMFKINQNIANSGGNDPYGFNNN